MAIEFSIIIPTYKRFEELILTLPQVVAQMQNNYELIIIEQSDLAEVQANKEKLETQLEGINYTLLHSAVPSVPLAWNTGCDKAQGRILIYLDDDVDFTFDIVAAHIAYYNDPTVVGVAGCYYASSVEHEWIPSSKNGIAGSLSGANMSFLKSSFEKIGAASSFLKPFAAVDWELCEAMNSVGKVVVGYNTTVLHRAPASGGCANQGFRGEEWYFGAYHNHTVWMLSRSFPQLFTNLPRHFYWLFKYCLPKKKTEMFTFSFFKNAIYNGIKAGWKTHVENGRQRKTWVLPETSMTLIASGKASKAKPKIKLDD